MKHIGFKTAENYIIPVNPFKGKAVKDIELARLDNFLGWAEDLPNKGYKLIETIQHIKRYLEEDHIAARLQVELDEKEGRYF